MPSISVPRPLVKIGIFYKIPLIRYSMLAINGRCKQALDRRFTAVDQQSAELPPLGNQIIPCPLFGNPSTL